MASKVRIVDALGVLLTLGAVVGATMSAVRVTRWQKNESDHRVRLVAQRMQDLATVRKHLERIEGILAERRSEAEAIDRRIPKAGEIGSFVADLDHLAASRGITLLGLKMEPPRKHEVYTKTPVQLSFAGSFTNVHRFIDSLEGAERIVEVGETVISRNYEERDCHVDMTVNVFEQ